MAWLRRLGVDLDVFFVDGRGNKVNYLWAYPRLWNTLRKKRYDVIHAHCVFSGLVARALDLGRCERTTRVCAASSSSGGPDG